MKADPEFSSILRCPETGQQVTWAEYSRGTGTCGKCGHQDKSTFTHAVRVVGRWYRPNLIQRLCGMRSVFEEK